MNEELQKRMLDYLDNLESAVERGSGFVVEQAPLVCQEWVNWVFAHGVVLFCVDSVAAVVMFIAAKWCMRQHAANPLKSWDIAGYINYLVVFCMLGLAISGVLGAVKAKVAPRIVILEKIESLSRSVP